MCIDKIAPVDVEENNIIELQPEVLAGLLKDRSTGKNIIWATDDYSHLGDNYQFSSEIVPEAITGEKGNIIMPRAVKSKLAQSSRTRNMAEVFTPTWICNKMNNLVDEAWFGRSNVFNEENGTQWSVREQKVAFPDYHQHQPKGWESYIGAKRLEITCGEAPYLVSRYDTVTGEAIPVEQRVGILDRKFQIINERTVRRKDKQIGYKRWRELAIKALRSTYGFEWQGDNVLLARENLLYTVMDYFYAKFGEQMPQEWLPDLVEIISWNIWQMDGLKCVVPNSCHDYKKQPKTVQASMFDTRAFSASVLKRSVSLCDVNEDEMQKCQGCLKDNVDLHNGVYCKIKNWSTGQVIQFKDLLSGQGSEGDMGKDFKFDVVIGNPPYQVEDGGGGAGKSATSIYNKFVSAAKELKPNYIEMITPSRWFNGGKGLDSFRQSMLNDKRIAEIVDFIDSRDCFPGVDISGGICYFLWKADHKGKCKVTNVLKDGAKVTYDRELNEFATFIRSNNAIKIVKKALGLFEKTMNMVVSSRKPFGLESNTKFDDDGDIILRSSIGLGHIKREKITNGHDILDKWKVVVSKVCFEHGGIPDKDGCMKVLSVVQILPPYSACTETYLVAGTFNTEEEAKNLSNYLKTKFVRFLLMQMLASMNMSKATYSLVPVQDFNQSWTDEKLFKKYNLTTEEVGIIEKIIKPMN